MTIEQLNYFIELVDERSFTKVAKNHFVAQSVVSYQIQKLEQELGVVLLERTTRSIRVTSAGRSFYSDIKDLVQGINHACENAKVKTSKVQFRLGYSQVVYGRRFDALLDEAGKMLPDIEFILDKREPEEGLVEMLQNGSIDMAFCPNPFLDIPNDIGTIVFGKMPFTALLYEGHPLCGKEFVYKDELDSRSILACEGMRKIEVNAPASFRAQDFDNRGILLKDMDSVFAMVRAKRGIACLPILEDVYFSQIEKVPLADEVFQTVGPQLTLCWSSQADLYICEKMQKLFRKHFA